MSEISINIDELIKRASKIKAPRYKTIKGKKFKFEKFKCLLDEDLNRLKEDIDLENIKTEKDWERLDKQLDSLVIQWEKEHDPIVKKILVIKYDLYIESFVKDEKNEIIRLIKVLNKLQGELNKTTLR